MKNKSLNEMQIRGYINQCTELKIQINSNDIFNLYDSDFGSSRTIRALCK